MNLSSFQLPKIQAPSWAQGGHLQTLWAHFLSSETIPEKPEVFTIDTPDGDHIVCENFVRPSDFIAVLLHGLSGDASADYMQLSGSGLLTHGIHTVLMNHRGAGPYWDSAKMPYHSGSAGDLSTVIGYLRQTYPGKKIVTIGFSMSGNVVNLNACGFRSDHVPDLAIGVNAPVDLQISSQHLGMGFNRVYDIRFVYRLRNLINRKVDEGLLDIPRPIPRFCTTRELDEIFTAPVSGFANRDDYYTQCSSSRYLSKVEAPLWLITSQDDPFVKINTYANIIARADLRKDVLPTGGHLGYLHDSGQGVERWLKLWSLELGKTLKSL